jgi:hypothetical protein
MIKIGGTEIVDIAVGSTPIEKAYIGSQLVWEKAEEGFVECNYIENTSTAYIDIGIANGATSWRIDAIVSVNEAKTGYIIGSRGASRYYQSVLVNSSMQFGTRMNNTTVYNTDYTLEIDKKYHLEGTPKSLTITDEDEQSFTITNSGGFVSNGHNIAIFNLASYVNTAQAFHGRIYSLKYYNSGGTLIRDYVPGRLNRQYGLMDKVNDVFYTSPNGVSFSGG